MRFHKLVWMALACVACDDAADAPTVPDAAVDMQVDATAMDAQIVQRIVDMGALRIDQAVLDRGLPDMPLADMGDMAPPVDMGIDPLAHGEALYTLHCAFCHGAEGEGYVSDNANALAHQGFLTTATDMFLATAIEYGRPGTPMPGLGTSQQGPLDDDDIAALVQYIRVWQTDPDRDVHDVVVDGLDRRGRPVYAALCEDCHGADGEEGEYISVANPWFLETASDGFIRTAIAEGRPGTPMPGFADRLTAQQLDDLTTLIRSWARPVDGSPLPMFEPDVEGGTLNPEGEDPQFMLRDDRFVGIEAVNAALQAGQRVFLLDARARADHFRERITDSVSIPHFELEQYLERLPRDVWIVAYCGCPHAISGQAFDILAAAGFERIAVLDEGYYEWRDAGYPVSEGVPE